jgi:heme-degrading monooxygenase HmoA
MRGLRPATSAEDDAVLLNAWVVSEGDQDEFVALINGLFEHLRGLDGFIEGAVLRGVNPTRFVSYARMRSARDRQLLFDDKEHAAALRAAARIASGDLHSYDVIRSFGPTRSVT